MRERLDAETRRSCSYLPKPAGSRSCPIAQISCPIAQDRSAPSSCGTYADTICILSFCANLLAVCAKTCRRASYSACSSRAAGIGSRALLICDFSMSDARYCRPSNQAAMAMERSAMNPSRRTRNRTALPSGDRPHDRVCTRRLFFAPCANLLAVCASHCVRPPVQCISQSPAACSRLGVLDRATCSAPHPQTATPAGPTSSAAGSSRPGCPGGRR